MFIRNLGSVIAGSVIAGTNFKKNLDLDKKPQIPTNTNSVLSESDIKASGTKKHISLSIPTSSSLESKKISIVDRFFSGASRLLRSIFSFIFGSTPKTSDTKTTVKRSDNLPDKHGFVEIDLD